MREILFRGKRVDNGKWMQGYLVSIEAPNIKTTDEKTNQKVYCITKPYIPFEITVDDADNFDLALYRVIPETIGQYTGLTDKNGTKIFEGDIVRIGFEDKIWETAREVVFEEGQWFFKCNSNSMKSYIGAWGNSVVEVIGNIHDNPELVKECEGK